MKSTLVCLRIDQITKLYSLINIINALKQLIYLEEKEKRGLWQHTTPGTDLQIF